MAKSIPNIKSCRIIVIVWRLKLHIWTFSDTCGIDDEPVEKIVIKMSDIEEDIDGVGK